MKIVKQQVGAIMAQAKTDNKEIDVDALSESVYCDLFAHSDQLTERMNFIKDFAKSGNFKLTMDHLALLWHEVIEDNQLSSDQKQVYTWFNDIAKDVLKEGLMLVDENVLIDFFKQKINSEESNFVNLSIEGYHCIQSFFVLINKRADKIVILGEEIIATQKDGLQSLMDKTPKVIKSASIDDIKYKILSKIITEFP